MVKLEEVALDDLGRRLAGRLVVLGLEPLVRTDDTGRCDVQTSRVETTAGEQVDIVALDEMMCQRWSS